MATIAQSRSDLEDKFREDDQDRKILNWEIQFHDLKEDCSQAYQRNFKDAWKVIKYGRSLEKLEECLNEMQHTRNRLDVCSLQRAVFPEKKEITVYYMTLLAHAVAQKKKKMVDLLLAKGASTSMGNGLSGSPLTQVLVHALNNKCPEMVDYKLAEKLADTDLNINVYYFISARSNCKKRSFCSPVELTIRLKRYDIAKLLVRKNADPIGPEHEKLRGVPQLFVEYFYFGTNNYMRWLFHEHQIEITEFIQKVLRLDIFNDKCMEMFFKVSRHPAHAILTSGCEKFIEEFIKKFEGRNYLTIKDDIERTALEISAELGYIESIEILLNLYSDQSNICDVENMKMDLARALLAAAREYYKKDSVKFIECVKCILYKDRSIVKQKINGISLLELAVREDLSCIFEAIRDFDQKEILKQELLIDGENTLAHRAAQIGSSKLFKVVFPLPMIDGNMFTALMEKDGDGKTPLEIAIENEKFCILMTLQERIKERESQPSGVQHAEKTQWNNFWEEWGPKLLVHACSDGSVKSVEFLIKMKCCPGGELPEDALPKACEKGKDEIVKHLLNHEQVSISNRSKNSSLLMAAKNNHAICVKLLLQSGADVNEEKDTREYTSLMLAIESKHENSVFVILSNKDWAYKALRHCSGISTPMRLLIEHLPEVAKWVLNQCAIRNSDGNETDGAEQELDNMFDIVEDYTSTDRNSMELVVMSRDRVNATEETDAADTERSNAIPWGPKDYKSENHPLNLMLKFEREDLLSHPLIKRIIKYKWKRIGYPGLLMYAAFYFIFLVFLTLFSVFLPHPNLRQNDSDDKNYELASLNMTEFLDDDLMFMENYTYCNNGWVEIHPAYFYFSAVLCLFFCFFYLTIECIQGCRRKLQYFKEVENYFQVILYFACIVYVFPAGHDEWCFPKWRWAFGAIVIFLAWLNCILILKSMPHFGQSITMLFNVYYNFLMLVHLPVLLVLTFGFSFYMLLVYDGTGFKDDATTFLQPHIALWNVIVQTAGVDDGKITGPPLLFPFLTVVLFIIFIIAMPLLFNNFLIGMAVGETEKEQKKASITRIKAKVKYIFEVEDTFSFIFRHILTNCFKRTKKRKYAVSFVSEWSFITKGKNLKEAVIRELRKENNDISEKMEAKINSEDMKSTVKSLVEEVAAFKQDREQARIQSGDIKNGVNGLTEQVVALKGQVSDIKYKVKSLTKQDVDPSLTRPKH